MRSVQEGLGNKSRCTFSSLLFFLFLTPKRGARSQDFFHIRKNIAGTSVNDVEHSWQRSQENLVPIFLKLLQVSDSTLLYKLAAISAADHRFDNIRATYSSIFQLTSFLSMFLNSKAILRKRFKEKEGKHILLMIGDLASLYLSLMNYLEKSAERV